MFSQVLAYELVHLDIALLPEDLVALPHQSREESLPDAQYHTGEIAVVGVYLSALPVLYQQVGGSRLEAGTGYAAVAVPCEGRRLGVGLLLEGRGHVYCPVRLQETLPGSEEVRPFDEVIPQLSSISRIEQLGTQGLVYRMPYQSVYVAFHHHFEFLCLTASKSSTAADTDTFSESSFPSIGILMFLSAASLHIPVRPVASVPITMAVAFFMSQS